MADLAEIARELYRLTPDAFTATRNKRAAEARADGDKELAASIRSLQKPSTAAWAINLFVRERSEEIGQVIQLGRTLRAAQADLDSDALRTLSQQRRQLVAALGKQAAALAKSSSHQISEAAVTEIEQTLNAAMADARAAAALKTARLTRSLDSVGLEPVDLVGAVAAADDDVIEAAAEDAVVVEKEARPPARIGPSKRQLADARQKAADATDRAGDATATVAAVARRIAVATRRRDEFATELEELKAEVAALETRVLAADRELQQLDREHDQASRTAEAAQSAARRARDRLDRLQGTE
ncbi:hypothetical protein GCM10027052_12270 [Parafrigoribacterium mesophilum]|uniref:transposase n=1 Tax=Parafrigoribacterium mesophilum TaxID=433646 RepID=UPI0031FDDE6E